MAIAISLHISITSNNLFSKVKKDIPRYCASGEAANTEEEDNFCAVKKQNNLIQKIRTFYKEEEENVFKNKCIILI